MNRNALGTKNLLSALGGVSAGALLMYLFDPEEGQARRQTLRDAAQSTLSGTGQTLGSAWGLAREKVRDFGTAASAGAAAFSEQIAKHAEDLHDQMSESDVGRRSRALADEASDRINYLVHGGERRGIQSCVGQSLAAIGCLAVGCTAMYLLDPTEGKRRRRSVRDRFLAGFGRMATSLERTGQTLKGWMGSGAPTYEERDRMEDRTFQRGGSPITPSATRDYPPPSAVTRDAGGI